MNKKNIALIAGIVIAVVTMRLFFNEMKWFNIFPIAALGVFVGSSFNNKRSAFLALLGAMIFTDVAFALFVPEMAPIMGVSMIIKYVAVLLVVLMGTKLDPSKFTKAIGFTIGGTLLFWLVSNFGSFLGYYDFSMAGLIECYLLAIPFYQAEGSQLFVNAFTANIAFGTLAFAVYNYVSIGKAQLAEVRS